MPPQQKRTGEALTAAPNDERLRSILVDHTCSITQELIRDPVMAEDGHLYEKESIVRWLATRSTSPRTNLPMGKTLVPSVVAKQTIANLMGMDGVVSDEAAAEWHFATGVAAVAAVDHEGALESFGRAAELGHEVAPFQIEAVARTAAARHFAAGVVAAALNDREVARRRFCRAAELGHEGASLQVEGVGLDGRVAELSGEVADFRRRAAEAGTGVSHFSFLAGSATAAPSDDADNRRDMLLRRLESAHLELNSVQSSRTRRSQWIRRQRRQQVAASSGESGSLEADSSAAAVSDGQSDLPFLRSSSSEDTVDCRTS